MITQEQVRRIEFITKYLPSGDCLEDWIITRNIEIIGEAFKRKNELDIENI